MPLLRNTTTDRIVATRIDRLSTFFQRAVGLLARNTLRPDEGVWINSCNAIHTIGTRMPPTKMTSIGLRVPIDVIFVGGDGRVMRLCRDVRPNRLALTCPQAASVVELGSGALREVDVVPGDYLELV